MTEPIMPKKGRFVSLTVTLVVSFLFLSLILLIVTSGMDAYVNFASHQTLIAQQQQLVADEAAHEVKYFIQDKFSVLTRASAIGDLATSDPQATKLVLDKLLGLEPSFRQVIVYDLKGQETGRLSRLSNSIPNQSMSLDKGGILSQVREGKQYFGSIRIDETTSEPMVIMAVPITDVFHDVTGALVAEVNLKFMWDLVGTIKIGEKGSAFVVDRQGNLIAYADISRVLMGENVADLEEVNTFMMGRDTVGGTAHISQGIKNEKVVANYVSLGQPDWAVVVELPAREAYGNTITSLELILVSLSAGLILAVLLGIYLSKRITKPIIQLRDAVVKIGEGKLDAQILPQSNDEIGQLSSSFNGMMNDLRESGSRLKKYTIELEEKVKERTKDLQEKNEQLEKSNRVFVDRELAMVELKKRISALEESTGKG
jgi:methyl-accepting chemotaxis protein